MANMFSETADPIQTIFQGVGAASRCWENLSGAGVFDDKQAVKVSEDMIDRLREQGVVFP